MLKPGYRYPNSQVLRPLVHILSILINQIRTNETLSLYTASPFLVLLLADRFPYRPAMSLFPSAVSTTTPIGALPSVFMTWAEKLIRKSRKI